MSATKPVSILSMIDVVMFEVKVAARNDNPAFCISRGSPEQVIDGWRYFGYGAPEGETMADVARGNTEVFLQVIDGARFAEPNPRPMFPNPHPGPLGI